MTAVKKTWQIDPVLLHRARKILDVKTEAEAITQALREMVRQHELDKASRHPSSPQRPPARIN